MCGIIGCVSERVEAVAPMLRNALKRLEYRGYDSVGVATLWEGKLHIKKNAGTIDIVHQELNLDDLPGRIGLGHTRWATHGKPSLGNAHPHMDCKGEIALAHNGIIENYEEFIDNYPGSKYLKDIQNYYSNSISQIEKLTEDTL